MLGCVGFCWLNPCLFIYQWFIEMQLESQKSFYVWRSCLLVKNSQLLPCETLHKTWADFFQRDEAVLFLTNITTRLCQIKLHIYALCRLCLLWSGRLTIPEFATLKAICGYFRLHSLMAWWLWQKIDYCELQNMILIYCQINWVTNRHKI